MGTEKPNFLTQPVVKSIFMYRNGDPYYEARRIVINEKRVSNFETLLREVTGGVQAPFGAVRNIYTPRGGHKVDCLESLQSGEQYVAAGQEKFKKLDYVQIGSRKKRMLQALPMQAKPLPHNRFKVSARFLKPIKEPCTIFVVANGDVLNPAVRLLIHQRTLGQFDRILEMITEKMGLRVLGGVRSLYTYDGRQVVDGNKLECAQLYVAVGREKFKRLPYGDLLYTRSRGTRRIKGMNAYSLPPIYRLSKQSGKSKSTAQCSEDENVESKEASLPEDNSKDKGHLSSIVREISQTRLLKKWKSGQSFTLTTSDNDPESKADDENMDSETQQDQNAEEKPDVDEDHDAKATEEDEDNKAEKVESASENTSEEEVSAKKGEDEKNQVENGEKAREEGKGDGDQNDEKEGVATVVNGERVEEVKEVKEEVTDGSKREAEGEERGSGSSNGHEPPDNNRKSDGSQVSSGVEEEQDKNRNEVKQEEESGNKEDSSSDHVNDVGVSEGRTESQNGSENIQSHGEKNGKETDRSTSRNSRQADDKGNSKDETCKESKESGEEQRKVNGEVIDDKKEVNNGDELGVKKSSKDGSVNGEKGDVVNEEESRKDEH